MSRKAYSDLYCTYVMMIEHQVGIDVKIRVIQCARLSLKPSHSVLTVIDPRIDATDAQLMRTVGYRTIPYLRWFVRVHRTWRLRAFLCRKPRVLERQILPCLFRKQVLRPFKIRNVVRYIWNGVGFISLDTQPRQRPVGVKTFAKVASQKLLG